MKRLAQMLRKEGGQALMMVLLLTFLGAMVIVPVLRFTYTNLKATQVVDNKTRDIYAADAGIVDGFWKVRYSYLPDWMLQEWNETTYVHDPYSYDLHDSNNPGNKVAVNGRYVALEIMPLWVLEELEEPSAVQGRTPDDRLLTYGSLVDDGVYEVSIMYDGSLDTLQIERIGCWLPPGFEYVEGSSNLEQDSEQPYYCIPQASSHNGGVKITWTFSEAIDYDDLPDSGSRRIVTFEFTPEDNPTDAFSWSRTDRPDDVHLSWDTSKRIFEITSRAPMGFERQITIVSHSVKKEFQALASAVNGDYQATGNTLLRDQNNDSYNKRERLYNSTSASITAIPNDATVEKIYLYWSGWKCKPWRAWNLSDAQLDALPAAKNVDKVALKVKVGTDEMTSTTVSASQTQAMRNGTSSSQRGWSYSCFADVTDLVTGYFKDNDIPFYGNAEYTVGHWDISTQYNASTYRYWLYNWKDSHQNETHTYYTRYPLGSPKDGNKSDTVGSNYYEDNGSEDEWSYAAWSVVVIYSSPSTAGHHLYVHDGFLYCDNNQTLSFDIKGFLAPGDVGSDPNAARMTCFVGEGDSNYSGDSFIINGNYQSDAYNPWNNVWNSRSNVLGGTPTDNGIDIDTFIAGGGTIIQPGDTEASIRMPTGSDSWNLVYIILSFSSEITTGGVIDYNIK